MQIKNFKTTFILEFKLSELVLENPQFLKTAVFTDFEGSELILLQIEDLQVDAISQAKLSQFVFRNS